MAESHRQGVVLHSVHSLCAKIQAPDRWFSRSLDRAAEAVALDEMLFKRNGGGTKRKYQVTAAMLKRIRWVLSDPSPEAVAARLRADVTPKDAAPVWAGIVTA